MYRHNAFRLALLCAVSTPALAVPPAEMDAAPVSAAPQPAQPGAASLQSADVRGCLMSTQVAYLAAPPKSNWTCCVSAALHSSNMGNLCRSAFRVRSRGRG